MIRSKPDANRRLQRLVDPVSSFTLSVYLNVSFGVTIKRMAAFKLSHIKFLDRNGRILWDRELETMFTIVSHHFQIKPSVVLLVIIVLIFFFFLSIFWLNISSIISLTLDFIFLVIIQLEKVTVSDASSLTQPSMGRGLQLSAMKEKDRLLGFNKIQHD